MARIPFDIVPGQGFKGMKFESENANTEKLLKKITDLETAITNLTAGAFTGTVITAKLTGGGTTGQMVFRSGVLVSVTPAT